MNLIEWKKPFAFLAGRPFWCNRKGMAIKIQTPAFSRVQTRNGTEIQISARVEIPGRKRPSDSLWFRFPAEFEEEISVDPDPFVVALLLVAMQARQNIEVEGQLPRKLLQGLEKYQAVFQGWYPERFHRVEVVADGFRDAALPRAGAAREACAFSGGVDSFHAFLELRPRLSHVVFMAGFDMPLNLTQSIRELTDSYGEMMREAGVKWVSGSTNIREFVNTADWTNAHGQALAATALFFKGSWSRFYIPSSYTGERYPKWGTHPGLDELLSVDGLQLVHYGAEANRVRKLEAVSCSPLSYHRLRVCWVQDLGLRNCGECEKCIRTMTALKILGVLSRYTTFATPLTERKTRALTMRTHQSRVFARELIREALLKARLKIASDLGISLARRRLFYTRFRLSGFLKGWFSFFRAKC